nr:hypothetical protein CFP56_45346 [Quercus suber]
MPPAIGTCGFSGDSCVKKVIKFVFTVTEVRRSKDDYTYAKATFGTIAAPAVVLLDIKFGGNAWNFEDHESSSTWMLMFLSLYLYAWMVTDAVHDYIKWEFVFHMLDGFAVGENGGIMICFIIFSLCFALRLCLV